MNFDFNKIILRGALPLAVLLLSACGGGGGSPPATPDTTPPTVSSTSPAVNATDVAVNSAITATFSENMDVSTISTASFTLDNGVTGAVSYSGITATFTPIGNLAYSTTYIATITTSVKDTAGNALMADYAWTFTTGTAPDTALPTVSSTRPAVNATGIAINSAITATFSENMAAATLTTATFTISGVTGAVTYTGMTATFTPTAPLAYSTTYTATITTGVEDAAGNTLAGNYTWTFTTATIAAPSGSLDASFGIGGKITTAIGTDSEEASAIAVQADGKIVAAGRLYGTNYDFALTRYNADGSLDTSFDTDGKLTTAIGTGSDFADAIAVQADGKIIAAGSSYQGTGYDFALARYNSDGSLDISFGTGGKVTTAIGTRYDYGNSLVLQADGKIVVAGSSDSGTNMDFALIRYNTDGSLDTSFGSGGKVTTAIGYSFDEVKAVAVQADGKIVAAGYSSGSYGDVFALARYNTDGSLDTSFDTDGKLFTFIRMSSSTAFAIAVQANGKIVVAGQSYNGTNAYFALARYNTNGSLDTGFGIGGIVTTAPGDGYARAIAIQADGKVVVAGFSYNGTNYDFALARYNLNGNLDTSFDTDGKLTTAIGTSHDFATAIAVQSDGKIIAAGYAHNGANYDFALARYWP